MFQAFFTYLYGASILFLLYVFCFLLQESSCCQSSGEKERKPPKPKKESKKDKENKKNQKKEKKEKKEKEKEKEKKDKDKKSKDEDKGAKEGKDSAVAAPPAPPPHPQQQSQRNSRSNIFQVNISTGSHGRFFLVSLLKSLVIRADLRHSHAFEFNGSED